MDKIYEAIAFLLEQRALAMMKNDRELAISITEALLDHWAALGEASPPFQMYIIKEDSIFWFNHFTPAGDAVYARGGEVNGVRVQRFYNEYLSFVMGRTAMDQRFLHPDFRFYREQHANAMLGIGTAFNAADPLIAEVLVRRMTVPNPRA